MLNTTMLFAIMNQSLNIVTKMTSVGIVAFIIMLSLFYQSAFGDKKYLEKCNFFANTFCMWLPKYTAVTRQDPTGDFFLYSIEWNNMLVSIYEGNYPDDKDITFAECKNIDLNNTRAKSCTDDEAEIIIIDNDNKIIKYVRIYASRAQLSDRDLEIQKDVIKSYRKCVREENILICN